MRHGRALLATLLATLVVPAVSQSNGACLRLLQNSSFITQSLTAAVSSACGSCVNFEVLNLTLSGTSASTCCLTPFAADAFRNTLASDLAARLAFNVSSISVSGPAAANGGGVTFTATVAGGCILAPPPATGVGMSGIPPPLQQAAAPILVGAVVRLANFSSPPASAQPKFRAAISSVLAGVSSVAQTGVTVSFVQTQTSSRRSLLQAASAPAESAGALVSGSPVTMFSRRSLIAVSAPTTDVRIVAAAAAADAPAVASRLLLSFADGSFISALSAQGFAGMTVAGIPVVPFVAPSGQAAFGPVPSPGPASRPEVGSGYDMALGFGLSLGIGVPLTFLGILWLVHSNAGPSSGNRRVSPSDAAPPAAEPMKGVRWSTSGIPPGQAHFYEDLKKLFPVDLPPRPVKVAAPAPSAAPFDRLLLVANNVMEAGVLRDAAAPGVAAVLYDYYLWTPEELLAAAKEAVGPGGRVASIGLVAAGQPGLVRVLRSADMQLDHADHLTLDIQALVQGLASLINGKGGLGRIDLISSNVASSYEGYKLLEVLRKMAGGVEVATATSGVNAGSMEMCTIGIPDVGSAYFAPDALRLWRGTCDAEDASKLDLLRSAMPEALIGSTMGGPALEEAKLTQLLGPAAIPGAQRAPPPQRNLFAILRAYLKKNRRESAALYREVDPSATGILTADQAAALVRKVVPDVTTGELRYFWSMVDADGDGKLTIKEFERSLKESRLTAEGRAGGTESLFQFSDVLRRLADRMDNSSEDVDTLFARFDIDNSGFLEPKEIQNLIQNLLPGADASEVRFILSHMSDADSNKDGVISREELRNALADVWDISERVQLSMAQQQPAQQPPAALPPLQMVPKGNGTPLPPPPGAGAAAVQAGPASIPQAAAPGLPHPSPTSATPPPAPTPQQPPAPASAPQAAVAH